MGFADFFAGLGSSISSGVGSLASGLVDVVGGLTDVISTTTPAIGDLFAVAAPFIELATAGDRGGGGRSEAQYPYGQPGPQSPYYSPPPGFPGYTPSTFGSFTPGRGFATPGDISGGNQMAIGGILPTLGRLGGILGRQAPGIAGGAVLGEVLEQTFAPSRGDAVMAGNAPFRPTPSGASAQMFTVPNPATGKLTTFRPAGRCILYSSDMAASKRVRKIAGRARRGR